MRYQSKEGFTLLELILVLFIAGLAVSMAAVAVNNTYKKTILRQEAARVQSMLRYAREMSLMHRTPHWFILEEDSNTYWIQSDKQVLTSVRKVHRELKILGESVIFFPKGTARGGFITITDSTGRGFYIEVDPATGAPSATRL